MLDRATTALAVGIAILAAAAPAATQDRGTIEFGAFASGARYDESIGLDNGWGGGGRVGAFILPRLSVEFDVGLRAAGRPHGLEGKEVEAFAARLTAIPLSLGPLGILVGAGIIHTDYMLDESDGFQALLGARLALTPSVAIRLDGLADFNRNETRNQSIQLGLSYYRSPAFLTRTVTLPAPPAAPAPAAAPTAQRPDSVSAAETRRLRDLEAAHRALRDSLAAVNTMTDVVHFAHDESALSDAARAILDEKVRVFGENGGMNVLITGHASAPGTDSYNLALGMRRAEAARDYLVSRGVASGRIRIASDGRGVLLVEGPGEAADAANRRAEFRILIAE